ncbi:restriction endonuclease subunit S [Amphritea sp. 2_MG-2023]|uniref:restriction endonuclease subunit S n=1 Tax=Amphritea TaxID=515417 RepID=UPI001C06E3B3|nr:MULTISPECIES: restriction endonuclease subunit S [Amphritea]MBU2967332.1 restriction endonuclease subunit S [Amphritea atlantica]MDO6418414.1 restriction endonuclease subunit S [Amphritea sp. 2_MG-2023]
MGSEWPVVVLSDVATLRNGAGVKQQFFSDVGIPLIRVSDFTQDSIDITDCKYVEETHAERWKEHFLDEGDVIVSTVGSWPPNWASVVGKVVRVPFDAKGSIQNQNTCSILPNDGVLDNQFLYYRLKLEDFSWHTSNNAGGSANQARLPVKKLGEFSFCLPPFEVQKYIGHSLEIFDNKIELNRQTNQTLEQMAQALFKSWFVDFDPVIDNALAAGNPIPEELQARAQRRQQQLAKPDHQPLPDDVRQLFPSEFEETEALGWVPKGWRCETTAFIADTNLNSWSKKNAPDFVEYVDLGNAKNGRINEFQRYKYTEAPSRAKRIMNANDTIVGLVRPGNRSFAYVHRCGLTGSTGFVVMSPKSENLRAYLYFHLTRDEVIDEFARLADGAAYPAIKPEVVTNFCCLVPSSEILDSFQLITGSYLKKLGVNYSEGESLSKLRNTLLPKLISGELRLPESLLDSETNPPETAYE